MGCGSSSDPVAAQASKDIDRQLGKDRSKMQRELKLLLLGTGASGKSTVAKQLKVIHLNGYSDAERALFREFIHINILTGLKSLLREASSRGVAIHADNEAAAAMLNAKTFADASISQQEGEQLFALWQDETVQSIWRDRDDLPLVDESVLFFYNELPRVTQEAYLPSLTDVLHVRIRSNGLKEISFAYGGYKFRVIDVGGQRSERRKWIHCFQDVSAVLFIVALSDYNMMLEEDLKTNRMLECVDLFSNVINNRWLGQTNVILFLNKKDLFEQKIATVPLTACPTFAEFKGDANDYDECIDEITRVLRSKNQDAKDRNIYVHQTCATDTDSIKVVWGAINDIIVQAALKTVNDI